MTADWRLLNADYKTEPETAEGGFEANPQSAT
jgi:hypothetical protein